MTIDFYDSIESDSVGYDPYPASFFATSKLVMIHDLLQKMDAQLVNMINTNRTHRQELADNLAREFSLQTLDPHKLEVALDLKNMITLNTSGMNGVRNWIQNVDPLFYELLHLPIDERKKVLENPHLRPVPATTDTLIDVQNCRTVVQELTESSRATLTPILAINFCGTEIMENGTYRLPVEALVPIEDGVTGSYVLVDELGNPLFVVKPIDEDISALNNPKGFGHFQFKNMFETTLYLAAFREKAVSAIATSIGVGSIAPTTALAILKCDQFFDIADRSPIFGPAIKEKLCSCMEFVPNAKSLFETLQDLQQQGLTDEEIGARFDHDDFEDLSTLLWTTGERDGHGGNILVYLKPNGLLGLKKIDNGLSFPEQPLSYMVNSLIHMPNAKGPLSEKALAKIFAIDLDAIAQIQQENHLEASIPSTNLRIARLREILTANPNLTIREIHYQLSLQPENHYEKSI